MYKNRKYFTIGTSVLLIFLMCFDYFYLENFNFLTFFIFTIILPSTLYSFASAAIIVDFQNNVAFVQQENFIFQDTVKNNITIYNDYSSKAIQKAMNYCCFGDNLKAETFLTEGGRDISGGEKQRIALARAKIKDSPLLLLDEFNSAFDEISKRQIITKLLAEEKKIIIFVTHDLRKEFLEKMDNIYLIDSGKIAEEGSFSELIGKRGSFYDLCNGKKSEV